MRTKDSLLLDKDRETIRIEAHFVCLNEDRKS